MVQAFVTSGRQALLSTILHGLFSPRLPLKMNSLVSSVDKTSAEFIGYTDTLSAFSISFIFFLLLVMRDDGFCKKKSLEEHCQQ